MSHKIGDEIIRNGVKFVYIGYGKWEANSVPLSETDPVLTSKLNSANEAHIHIKAGTAAKAPLKFSVGDDTIVPEAGTMEYDGSGFHLTETVTRRFITTGSDVTVADVVVVNTTDETVIHTSPVPANEFRAGKMYRLILLGKFSTASNGDLFTMRFYVGGLEIFSAGLTTGNVYDAHFKAEFWLTIRTIGSGGTYAAHVEAVLGDDVMAIPPSSGAIDTTGQQDFDVTVEWNVAKLGNTLTLMQSVLEVIN